MEGVTQKLSELDLKRVRCQNCNSLVLPGNLSRHQRTKKCLCKNVYRTRAEIGKERVKCPRCSAEVCKNKIKRHMRTQKCKLATFSFQ